MIVAIDGPAASGKGTIARRLAQRYDLAHLDTGLLYRAVAKAMLDAGEPLDDRAAATQKAQQLDVRHLDRDVLSRHDIAEAASKISVIPDVRQALLKVQRDFASQERGAVLDGRDIGTVICPDADVKLFVTASAEARALRRFSEMKSRQIDVTYDGVLSDIKRRDERDSTRNDAPLTKADDAYLIDTTKMDIEAAFSAAIAVVERQYRNKRSVT